MNIIISNKNTLITQSYLTQKEEHQYFERKGLGETDIKPSKIAEELIGMLNADGGVLAFGIADNGTLQDLNSIADKLKAYRTLMHDFIQPPCNIELEEVLIENNLVFLYHVEQDFERLYSLKDNEVVFLRVFDTNRKLDRAGVKKLEYDKTIRKFEDELATEFDLNDIDNKILENYQQKLNFKGDALELLYMRHLAKKHDSNYLLKNSTVLLFGGFKL
jgi:ATP-dependent DNA helicase RecG